MTRYDSDLGSTCDAGVVNPSSHKAREGSIDALRGAALLGVLLLNLLTEFRVPLITYLAMFHTEPGTLNHIIDWVVGLVFERKCFAVLSILFGAGISAISLRNDKKNRVVLFRRFSCLLILGLTHFLLIFSGDILTLYAVCGFIFIGCIGFSERSLWAVVVITLMLRFMVPSPSIPHEMSASSLTNMYISAYGNGTFSEALDFRMVEIKHVIAPLLFSVTPRTFALMTIGFIGWRKDWISLIRKESSGQFLMRSFLLVGICFTALEATVAVHDLKVGQWSTMIGDIGVIALAFGYSSVFLRMKQCNQLIKLLAPLGRLSLTAYLTQTTTFALIFYGFGFGLFGKMKSFETFLFGMVFYVCQIYLARFIIRRYHIGPMEWLWRRWTYGASMNL